MGVDMVRRKAYQTDVRTSSDGPMKVAVESATRNTVENAFTILSLTRANGTVIASFNSCQVARVQLTFCRRATNQTAKEWL